MVQVLEQWQVDVEEGPLSASKKSRARSQRRVSAGPESGLRRGQGWVRQPADTQLLEFISLHSVITLRQAAKWFYGGVHETARERVRKMDEAGLLERNSEHVWAGTLIFPTMDGQTIGLGGVSHPLRKPASLPRQLEHKLAVIDQVLMSQSRGRHVISEREIRMLEAADEQTVIDYLQRHGAKHSRDGITAGIVPSLLTVVRELPASQGGGYEKTGERRAWLGLPVRGDIDEQISPGSKQRSHLRYPDFIEITDTGELVAVEVEISNKASRRMLSIVRGYRDSLAHLESAENSGTGKSRMRRQQFRSVRWVCSPEVMATLQGKTHFTTGDHTPGLLQQEMPDVFGKSYDWAQQNPLLPVQVMLAWGDDPGVQYALDQRFLEAKYHCTYAAWVRWQGEWKSVVPETERGHYTFPRWIRAKGNLQRCKALIGT